MTHKCLIISGPLERLSEKYSFQALRQVDRQTSWELEKYHQQRPDCLLWTDTCVGRVAGLPQKPHRRQNE